MARKKMMSLIASLVMVAFVAASCAPADNGDGTDTDDPTETQPTSATGAADLRAGLTALLTEHVYLAALATGAALRGETTAFNAWAEALNGEGNSNTSDLVGAVTSAYGSDVGEAFEGLWRSEDHIGGVVRYTQAVAADDQAAADQAVQDLLGYAKTFGETMESVNENLPAGPVEEGVVGHITSLKAVIDAQKAGDQTAVYTNLREAYHHMDHLARTIAGATVAKFPDAFDGDSSSAAADLRAGLTSLLQEHVYLASSATGGALAGRGAQFEAAAAALNGPANSNTSDLVDAVRSIYGDEVGDAFDGLWRSEDHIDAVVRYTQAVAADDDAAADQAVQDLLAYAAVFGETMASVNENLPADVVTEEVTGHITSLKAVIDAQKAGNPNLVALNTRRAAHHMQTTADALAEATVAKFPEQF